MPFFHVSQNFYTTPYLTLVDYKWFWKDLDDLHSVKFILWQIFAIEYQCAYDCCQSGSKTNAFLSRSPKLLYGSIFRKRTGRKPLPLELMDTAPLRERPHSHKTFLVFPNYFLAFICEVAESKHLRLYDYYRIRSADTSMLAVNRNFLYYVMMERFWEIYGTVMYFSYVNIMHSEINSILADFRWSKTTIWQVWKLWILIFGNSTLENSQKFKIRSC